MPHEYAKKFQSKDAFGSLIGHKIVALNEKECLSEIEVHSALFNPTGILHGGVLFGAMDSSQGAFVHFDRSRDYQVAVTGTATVKYLQPVKEGKVSIRTWPQSREGRKIFVSSEARDSNGVLLATLDEIWIALK